MARRVRHEEEEGPSLFTLPEPTRPEPKVKQPLHAIWTENKAKLIERYLHYFVFITHHGTYIDGFAGPQKLAQNDSWAAKLVLENEPRWLRNFYLFDKSKKQEQALKALVASQPEPNRGRREPNRHINIQRGDFNVLVLNLLASEKIKQKEATFCLLDQRTFECHWATLQALAGYKTSGYKIELFYFLPHLWFNRSLANQKEMQTLDRWWGRKDWAALRKMNSLGRAQEFVKRFKKELGYASVKPWPIYKRQDSKTVMYYMIHATDHPDAPMLMSRAYSKAVTPETPQQFHLWAKSVGIQGLKDE